jgi:hypothetical protein
VFTICIRDFSAAITKTLKSDDVERQQRSGWQGRVDEATKAGTETRQWAKLRTIQAAPRRRVPLGGCKPKYADCGTPGVFTETVKVLRIRLKAFTKSELLND